MDLKTADRIVDLLIALFFVAMVVVATVSAYYFISLASVGASP